MRTLNLTLTWALIASLFSFFALLLSLWDIDDKVVSKFPEVEPIVVVVPYLAVVVLILVLVLFVFYLAEALYVAAMTRLPSALQNITSVTCREEDLPLIRQIAEREIGQVTSADDTLALYRQNKHSFRKIVDTKSHDVLGYFCVLPLTEKGVERVKERNLLSAPIDFSCFAKKFKKGSDVYIGGIAGVGARGKAGAHEQLKLFVVNKSVFTAYARPMTKRGVELAKENGFQPVSGDDKLVEGVYAYKVRSI